MSVTPNGLALFKECQMTPPYDRPPSLDGRALLY
jgi:hypothetical protein